MRPSRQIGGYGRDHNGPRNWTMVDQSALVPLIVVPFKVPRPTIEPVAGTGIMDKRELQYIFL